MRQTYQGPSVRMLSMLCCAAMLVIIPYGLSVESVGPNSGDSQSRLQLNDAVNPGAAGYFVENSGQLDSEEILFYARSGDMQVGFAESSVFIKIVERQSAPTLKHPMARALELSPPPGLESSRGVLVRLFFEGANRVSPQGENPLPFPTNFFIGNDPSRWRTDVRSFREVVYRGLYDGIDLVYRMTDRGVKYDLVVAPGASLDVVRMSYEGAESVAVDATGGLRVRTFVGDLGDSSPVAFQGKDEVPCSFVAFTPRSSGIVCEGADPSRELVLDPLLYSTYLGGSSEEIAYGIAVDSAGNAYVTGYTESADIPTTPGVFGPSLDGFSDAFVAKLDPTGGSLLYATYLGGSFYEMTLSIAVDSSGNAYVTGNTGSSDFPVTPGAFDTTFNGVRDGFVAKLNSTGGSLVYATYIGGSGTDDGVGIAVDSSGRAYLTGNTDSANFPVTPGAFDTTYYASNEAYVTVFNTSGGSLLYSTYLCGGGDDRGVGIAVDSAGNAYAAGYASSPDFPTTPGSVSPFYNGGTFDAFVTKLSPDGGSLIYSTYLGGSMDDYGFSIALDSGRSAYVTGLTQSLDFPSTPGAFQTDSTGTYDAYVAKLSSTGDSLSYATYLGGVGEDDGVSITVNAEGNAYVAGLTGSNDFPVTSNAYDSTYNGMSDCFVSALDVDGGSLLYSSFIGDVGDEAVNGVAADTFGFAYLTGFTSSSGFPTTSGAFDTSFNGGPYDAFVLRLVVVNARPSASGLGVQGFTSPPAILHITDLTPDLNWTYSDPEGDPQAWYDVRVGTATGLGDMWDPSAASGNATVVTYGGTPLVRGVDYYFGVKVNDSLSWSTEEEVMFHVNSIPGAPTPPISPAQDSMIPENVTQTVSWTSGGDNESDVIRYEWQVSTDASFFSTIAQGTTTDTTSTAFATSPSSTYHWRVRARDDYEPTTWSSYGNTMPGYWTFNTSAPPNTPPTISITSPSGGEVWMQGTSQPVSWTVADNEDAPSALLVWINYTSSAGAGNICGPIPGDVGSCLWTLPMIAATDVVINGTVADSGGLKGYDESGQFIIEAPPPNMPPVLAITYPSGGEVFYWGGSPSVTWTSSDAEDPIATLTFWINYTSSAGSGVICGPQLGIMSCDWPLPSITANDVVVNGTVIDTGGLRGYDESGPFAISPPPNTPPTVSISAPSGGEVWIQDTPHEVNWTASDSEDASSALLVWINYTSGAGSGSICGPVAGDLGTCAWTLPIIAATDVVVNGTVIDTGGLIGYNESGSFVIEAPPPVNTPPTITIASPTGGEVWTQGSLHSIIWTASDSEDASSALLVWINYTSSAGGGNICGPVAGNVGSCAWTVPAITATDVAVNGTVVDSGGLRGFDESGQFTIQAPPPVNTPPMITIESPLGGEVWIQGSAHAVTWTATDNEDASSALLVWMNFTSGAGSGSICGPVAGNVGTCAWTLPVIAATDVVVSGTVVDIGGLKGYDDSGQFAIQAPPPVNTPPTATITSPTGGESWLKGSSCAINWTMHDDQDDNANLTVYVNYTTGGTTITIVAGVKGAESFIWTLPDIEVEDIVVNITVIDTGGLKGWDETGLLAIRAPPPPRPVESNYKPLVALVFSIVLAIFGLWSSRKEPWDGEEGRTAVLMAFAVFTLPFILAECVTAVASLFIGEMRVPPSFGAGTVIDVAILLAGLAVAMLRVRKTEWKKSIDEEEPGDE